MRLLIFLALFLGIGLGAVEVDPDFPGLKKFATKEQEEEAWKVWSSDVAVSFVVPVSNDLIKFDKDDQNPEYIGPPLEVPKKTAELNAFLKSKQSKRSLESDSSSEEDSSGGDDDDQSDDYDQDPELEPDYDKRRKRAAACGSTTKLPNLREALELAQGYGLFRLIPSGFLEYSGKPIKKTPYLTTALEILQKNHFITCDKQGKLVYTGSAMGAPDSVRNAAYRWGRAKRDISVVYPDNIDLTEEPVLTEQKGDAEPELRIKRSYVDLKLNSKRVHLPPTGSKPTGGFKAGSRIKRVTAEKEKFSHLKKVKKTSGAKRKSYLTIK